MIVVYAFSCAHLLLVALVYAIPVHDLIYQYQIYNGGSAYIAYTFGWWILFVFIVVNYLLPLLLLGVMGSYSKLDVHSIFTVLALVVNTLVVILGFVCYFFLMNTSYSGWLPFNDPRWCCLYNVDHPELCANVDSCQASLAAGGVFVALWVLAAFLLVGSFVHLVMNRLIRISGMVRPPKKMEGLILGTSVSMIGLLAFAYWCAFPLQDTMYVYGYPTLGIPPGPGIFVKMREVTFQWWFVWLLVGNLFPPLAYLGAVALESKSKLVKEVHFWICLAVSIVSVVSLLVFLGIWIGWCNYGWSAGSICNDPRWCCVFFGSNYDVCGNVTPCTDSISLSANAQFIQHVVFSALFTFLASVQVWLNYRMKAYGVWE